MKCSVCGKEFGNDMKCQYCGTDRVTGLAHYSGYDVPESDTINNASSFSQDDSYVPISRPNIIAEKSIVCYNCGEIIPADSKFCPHCSTNLYVTCPKCGHEYSSQYPACNKCGTNRADYYEQKRKEENWQKEYERKRREEERKRREWEQSPEGQAEIARKKEELLKKEKEKEEGKAAAEQIRKDIMAQHNGHKIIGWICAIGTVWLFARLYQFVGGHPDPMDLALPFIWEIVFGIWFVISINMSASKTESDIQKWKKDHPNDIATPYL